MSDKSIVLESIINGQRKQAWEQMLEFQIGLRDITQEIGAKETMVMLEIGINNGFVILNKRKKNE